MIWVLILCVIGLVVAAVNLKKSPDVARPVVVVFASLTILLVIIRMFSGGEAGGNRVISEFTDAAGFIVGQRIATELTEPGVVVMIAGVPPASNNTPHTVSEATATGLTDGLKDSGSTLAVYDIQTSRIGMGAYSYVEGEIIKEVLDAHADPAAIVFVQCLPRPSRTRHNAQLYAIGISTPDTSKGNLPSEFSAVATFKGNVDWTAKPDSGMSAQEVFDLRYRMLPE